jgi:hypothetical protein
MSHKDTSQEALAPRSKALRLGLLVGAVVLLTSIAAGCGESEAEKAQAKVCDARADLKTQTDNLAALTPETATADGVEKNLKAIENDLKQIKNAQPDLNDERKQQVESATQAFASEVEAVARDLDSGLSASGARAKLETAGQQLASSYRQAFARIDCG